MLLPFAALQAGLGPNQKALILAGPGLSEEEEKKELRELLRELVPGPGDESWQVRPVQEQGSRFAVLSHLPSSSQQPARHLLARPCPSPAPAFLCCLPQPCQDISVLPCPCPAMHPV